MERVIGWVDGDGGQGAPGGPEPFARRPGLRLRPTGMVVFATLEESTPDPALARRASTPGWALSEPSPGGERVRRGAMAKTPALTHQLRHRAWRGAAWLLGR